MKTEYKALPVDRRCTEEQFTEKVQELGKEGWLLCGIVSLTYGQVAYFARPAVSVDKAEPTAANESSTQKG